MEVLLIILVMIALLLLQGFFSGSEIALVHADRLKLRHRANQGNQGAEKVLKFLHKPEVLLGTTLVGTNVSVVALTTLGTILMISFFGEYGDIYSFLIYTPLFLVLFVGILSSGTHLFLDSAQGCKSCRCGNVYPGIVHQSRTDTKRGGNG